jgi:hypothetical protein
MKKIILASLAIAVLFLAVGCGTRNWLVSNKFHGDNRTVKEVYSSKIQAGQVMNNFTGKGDPAKFYDYKLRVCFIDEKATLNQCMDTVVIENVMQNTLFNNFMTSEW